MLICMLTDVLTPIYIYFFFPLTSESWHGVYLFLAPSRNSFPLASAREQKKRFDVALFVPIDRYCLVAWVHVISIVGIKEEEDTVFVSLIRMYVTKRINLSMWTLSMKIGCNNKHTPYCVRFVHKLDSVIQSIFYTVCLRPAPASHSLSFPCMFFC